MTGTVTATFEGLTRGTVEFRTNTTDGVLRDPTGNVLWSGPKKVRIVDGAISVVLPATDDTAYAETEWQWCASVKLDGKSSSFLRWFELPDAGTVDLADIAGELAPGDPLTHPVAYADVLAGIQDPESEIGLLLSASIDAALTDYIPKGTDLITDGGFETGDYSALTDRFSVVSSDAHGGAKAFRIAVGSGASQLYEVESVTVTAGQVYEFTVWYKTSSDFAGESKLRIANGDGTLVTSSGYFSRSADYREIKFTYTIPAGFVGDMKVQIHGFHSVGTVHVDDVALRLVDPSIADAAFALTPDLLAAGQQAIATATRVLRSSEEERTIVTPDGRTTTTIVNGDTTAWTVSGVTQSDDATRTKDGATQSKRFASAGAGAASARLDMSLTFPPGSIVRSWVWLDDPTKVSALTLDIYQDSGPATPWTRAASQAPGVTLRRGWNLLSWAATAGTHSNWGNVYRLRYTWTASAATAINVQRVWVESPAKAQIMFVADRGYRTFVDDGLPDFRSRGLNLTWALDPLTHGMYAGTKNEVITDAEVATFYAAGDDVSLHELSGEVTSTMSGPRLVWNYLSALKWCIDRGFTRGLNWRAAWTQNLAPQHALIQPYAAAYATPTDNGGVSCWPPLDRYNIARIGLHNRSEATVDGYFTSLTETHGLVVFYTHGIHTEGVTLGGADMTPTEWAYFWTKADAMIAAGTLEFVTFSQLLSRAGGVLRAA
jgi:hypothetical protein